MRLASALCVPLLLIAGATPASAGTSVKADGDHQHAVLRGAVAAPKAVPGKPLPKVSGTVAVRPSLPLLPAPRGLTGPTRTSTALLVPPKLQLRALIVGVDAADWGVATWKQTVDRVGAAYDVLYSKTAPLTAADLVGVDGVGKYNAILLTSSSLLYDAGGGSFVSGLDATEWNTLWAYERDFAVRQAVLYTSYGAWPEDYCLTASSEVSVGDTPLSATLPAAGQALFDDLKTTAVVKIQQSYVYKTRIAAGCAASSILQSGADILGVQTTSTDGRERAALTFTSNQYLMQSNLLAYGLFRWASRGMYLGDQKHYLQVDIDDWFNSADHYTLPNGTIVTDPPYQVSGHDAYNLRQRMNNLRSWFPLANGFTFSLAYNGADADLTAVSGCSPNGGIETLTATSRCLRTYFRWLNHTYTHPELNFTTYAESAAEITQNRTLATTFSMSQPNTVLKTGEYSGLGVYNPDPNDDVNPPTDYGLGASNLNFLQAARDNGVQYVHGNMSFASHVPSCFNCGIDHPLEPSIMIVPDWPTNIAYHTTTPDEQTHFYNGFYGPNGRFPFFPVDQTYAQMKDYETNVALSHVATGSIYTHTFHIANVKDYGGGETLVTDWAHMVMQKYSALYKVPLLCLDWATLATNVKNRTRHMAVKAAGAKAVYDPSTGTIEVSSPTAGPLIVTGASAAGYTTYGAERTSTLTMAAGGTTTVIASPRS
ncbi:hypothetical protein Ais01nite_68190 [Asanoa ishikariensis]|uniref:Agd3-related carbohydrate-binding protein n=1 Tax=Asanoa ishikariensis TaxID=137265 RepID=UPI001A3C02F8|nr:hypothetical protein [Asanoa ishikariensis]GIF68784.1 hypothetical protein Ais01nite_68190 [Asanoa ishikariensis]